RVSRPRGQEADRFVTAYCPLPPADFPDRHLLGRQARRRAPATASRPGGGIGACLSRFLFARAAVVETSACHCLVAVGGAATAIPDPAQRPGAIHRNAALAAVH